jgi:anthranilate 1,2-dioxygenase large subunit/terephthalate 1,2-dioxygenase oxygenase component alpha subunit
MSATSERQWPGDTLASVPYWVYQDPDVYQREQRRIYEGPNWNYLCLEAEIPKPGDFRTTFVGEMPVVVVRDDDGAIHVFENRCAHRGALICIDRCGSGAKSFTCVYHSWSYDRRGNLTGVAFRHGVAGKGGMPADFRPDAIGPRKLATATLHGLVFGTLDPSVPPIEEYVGKDVLRHLERVLRRPVVVIGRFTQVLPNNWKLYFENNKDTYHASLLHLFFTTFRLNTLAQRGAIVVDDSGGNHVSYSIIDRTAARGSEYSDQGLRADSATYRLHDPSVIEGFKEFDDDITLQILTVFPGFVLQQIGNAIAVRQVLPKGIASTDLNWTYLGFADDTPERRRIRLKQANLMGPAGFVSMEDGAVGGFVQRGIVNAATEQAVVRMGGEGVASSQDTRATETSVRGFWKRYRAAMGF